MTFDENAPKASFDLMAGDDIVSKAPKGTSLIGVLAGADRLSPVEVTEGKELTALGCAGIRSASGAPLLRLAPDDPGRPAQAVCHPTPNYGNPILAARPHARQPDGAPPSRPQRVHSGEKLVDGSARPAAQVVENPVGGTFTEP